MSMSKLTIARLVESGSREFVMMGDTAADGVQKLNIDEKAGF